MRSTSLRLLRTQAFRIVLLYAVLATSVATAFLAESPWWVHLLYFLISGGLGQTLGAAPIPVLLAIGLCVSLFLHWFFVGLAARRLGRSVTGWVALAVLGFPITSIVALVLYYWLEAEHRPVAGARP